MSAAKYQLIYWPGIPGRGEPIRLVLEEAGAAYTDTAFESTGMKTVQAEISTSNHGDPLNPPPFAPPILKTPAGASFSQLPNILQFLGQELHLAPDVKSDPVGFQHVNALTLTLLDGFSNEPHDTHHPVAVGQYYEDQKEAALARARDYRETRLPKFLGYFQRVLDGPASRGGEYLYGGVLTYADLVLFQVLNGTAFAFPRAVARMKKTGKYGKVFALCDRVEARPNVAKYLKSERRQEYSQGVYRYYPELDDQE